MNQGLDNHDSAKFSLVSYGPSAWLIVGDASDAGHRELTQLAAAIEANPPAHFVEWVLGFDTLLLIFGNPVSKEELDAHLRGLDREKLAEPSPPTTHEIYASYDGPDLDDFSKTSGLTIEEIIKRHTAPTYRVRFMGFAPGFAYLDGLDPSLSLPRKAHPRVRMEPGAIAIGGSHTGIYTVPSPGGWHWIGNTDHPLFNPDDEIKPFALAPGDQLRFIHE